MPRAPKRSRDARDPRRDHHRAPSALGSPYGLITIPVFGLLYWAADRLWNAPEWGVIVYAGASALAFIVYAVDKVAAKTGASRISEVALQLLAVACGWPGALLAQQTLRHKTAKPAFLWMFWLAAVLNTAGFLLWCSPLSPRVVGAPRIDETAVDLNATVPMESLDQPASAPTAPRATIAPPAVTAQEPAPSPSRPVSSPPQ